VIKLKYFKLTKTPLYMKIFDFQILELFKHPWLFTTPTKKTIRNIYEYKKQKKIIELKT
jgi:hypothetical protein